MGKIQYIRSAIGLEITNDKIVLAQVQSQDEAPYVSRVKMCSLPANCVVDGVIVDSNRLAQLIRMTMNDGGFSGQDLIVSFSDREHVKATEQFPLLSRSELTLELEMRVAANRLFYHDNFKIGYQGFKEDSEGGRCSCETVLYAASSHARIASIQGLADTLEMTLIAVDLSSLAIVRTVMWKHEISEEPYMIIVGEPGGLDCFIVWSGAIIFTQSLRIESSRFFEEPEYVDAVLAKLTLFLRSYTNQYPHLGPVSVCVCVSRLDRGVFLFDKLVAYCEDIDCRLYSIDLNIPFDSSLVESTESNDFTVAIGLGFKFFEKYNQTLSLTSPHKRRVPAFNRQDLLIFIIVIFLCFFVVKGVRLYIAEQTRILETRLVQVKGSIKALESGKAFDQQKQQDTYQHQINQYTRLHQHPFSKVTLMKVLLEAFPEDVSIVSLTVSEKNQVKLDVAAYYPSSIFNIQNSLKFFFSNVDISHIQTKKISNHAEENTCHIRFDWRGL